MTAEHTILSSSREKLIEHLFVGELLKRLWLKGITDAEVLRPEVDAGGYDLAIACRGVTRSVQLKSSYLGSRTARQKVNLSLAEKPGGCVVWIYFESDTLKLGPFLWFGGRPGERLPDISSFPVAKHTKGDAKGVKRQRPAIRIVNKQKFETLDSMDALIAAMFDA